MSLLDKLERRFGFLAIHNLTLYIVGGQIVIFVMALLLGNRLGDLLENVLFRFDSFIDGKPWTVISFLFIPRYLTLNGLNMVWLILSWLMLYSLGSQLERAWGSFRYSLFIFIGVVGVIFASLLFPKDYMTNYFLLTSVWFAFFITFPDVPFFFGIKAKWLGLLFGLMILGEFIESPSAGRMLIIGSLINIPIFFGKDIVMGFRSKQRVRTMKADKRKLEMEPFHVCSACGATDLSHPERTFRYRKEGALCSECSEPVLVDDGV